mgnify:CR=1 FL=1
MDLSADDAGEYDCVVSNACGSVTTDTYTLTEADGTTTLTATMDMAEAEAAYFEQKFPEALQKVKALAEG